MSKGNEVSEDFRSWESFMAAATEPVSGDMHRHASSVRPGRSWAGTDTFEEAVTLARTGWPEGFREIAGVAERVKATIGTDGNLCGSPTEAGDEVDVGLYLSGEPECMVEFLLEPRPKPVVKFVISTTFAAGVDTESIYNRGAAVVAAVDTLEGSGVRVEIELDETISCRTSSRYTRRVFIKRADEALDRDLLAFAVAHASFLRRLIFRLHETKGQEHYARLGGGTYGYPENPERLKDRDEGAVIIPCMKYGERFDSIEKAVEAARGWVAEALEGV